MAEGIAVSRWMRVRCSSYSAHPDVCRGSNCVVGFTTTNEAYGRVMKWVRGEWTETLEEDTEEDCDCDNLWEEWMGWEGAGIRDFSSHVNPYI